MLQRAALATAESIVSDLRKQAQSEVRGGFEIVAPAALVPPLRDMLDHWFTTYSDTYALLHIRRYIVGFAAIDSAFGVQRQPISRWMFVYDAQLPDGEWLFRATLLRSIQRRYLLHRIPRNRCNGRLQQTRATQIAETILQRARGKSV